MYCWRRRQRKWEGGRRGGRIVGKWAGRENIQSGGRWGQEVEGERRGRGGVWKVRKLEGERKRIFRSGFIVSGIPFNVPRKIEKEFLLFLFAYF